MIENQFDGIATEYIELENDPALSWYELEVNWPSLQRMLPEPPAKILDYGAAGGAYAELMQNAGYVVLATDNAPKMVEQIQGVPAKVWNYTDAPLGEKFDVIMCKLVVQFVEDLPAFAVSMHKNVNSNGVVIVSIPNPEKTREIADDHRHHFSKIGQSDLSVTMIHREKDEYISAFADAGFLLEKAFLPVDPEHPDEIPKRLNMLFRVK